jgi:hypothetical protein
VKTPTPAKNPFGAVTGKVADSDSGGKNGAGWLTPDILAGMISWLNHFSRLILSTTT